jgi:hypothetical protein
MGSARALPIKHYKLGESSLIEKIGGEDSQNRTQPSVPVPFEALTQPDPLQDDDGIRHSE